jgi:ATP-dependent exoDNAse (exonuclease V) beta subunit
MTNPTPKSTPTDQPQRERALNPANSVLVQAPAGSGKTDLLTRRFLRLLTEVEDPSQIVAITFTKAAAAEMRYRILAKLEEASAKGTGFSPYIQPSTEGGASAPDADPFSMESLAQRALHHSQTLGWNLLDQPAQLRISTIDSFCRDIALQQPLLSGLGDGLGIYDQPEELYRRAARQALQQIDGTDLPLRSSIEALLLWRDNNWSEMEDLLVQMLQSRDRWMHGFVLEREQDWDALRESLERPFAKAIQQSLAELGDLLDQVPGARDEALALARFACQQGAAALFQPLAELPDFPADPTRFDSPEEAQAAYVCLSNLLLTLGGDFRKTADKRLGFPADRKREKAQLLDLISRLAQIPGLQSALAATRSLPPARYSDDDWQIVRACFTLLRNAAAQLRVVFAEAGAVDYTEVAQIALSVLTDADGSPSDAAQAIGDGIRHLLVDEFQDTSRRQHELLRRLIAAWPDREGRSCFVVGDPMQSIYFFRDADAELFPRVKAAGLEIPNAEPLLFDAVALTSNFRTARPLVVRLNEIFSQVFAANDGSGVTFTPADPASQASSSPLQPSTSSINYATQTTETKATCKNQHEADSTPASHTSSNLLETHGNDIAFDDLTIRNKYPYTSQGSQKIIATIPPSEEPFDIPPNGTKFVRQLDVNEASYNTLATENNTSNLGAFSAPPASFRLHVLFPSQPTVSTDIYPSQADAQSPNQSSQVGEIVSLIRGHQDRILRAKAAGEKYRVAVLVRTRNVLAPVALALREDGLPFRAVDLEKLSARPEVLDVLSLVQALLNPLNRVAWLGLLRAPWCGLSLADLHTLTSADAPELLDRPIPELLFERLELLTPDGRLAVQRVLAVLDAVPELRFAQPAASLGGWLQQVWLRLGGAQCVTPTERANLDLLWQKLDSLPNGEQDLLGPALESTLKALTAQPDPETSSDCGIQLMTIHKSKGLEFEVVIIPDLQAGSSHGGQKLLSWLERGLPPDKADFQPDGSPEITEFLIAPLQSKGADRGSAKLWVDRVYRERESQEMRRLLYVAATRARNELHFFAQPACKLEKDGSWTLADPKDSLLKTAWPALEREIHFRFAEWQSAQADQAAQSHPEAGATATIDTLAASAEGNLLVMPSPITPTRLRRLPPSYHPNAGLSVPANAGAPSIVRRGTGTGDTTEPQSFRAPSIRHLSGEWVGSPEPRPGISSQNDSPYPRHQGGLESRALGTAVHAFLEQFARLRKTKDRDQSRAALTQHQPAIAAKIRATGLDQAKAAAMASEALGLAVSASSDPIGNWILSPHPDDASEIRWTGVVAGGLRTVQVDRLFRAGLHPLTEGTDAWWIVDYKTAQADITDPAAALPELRARFAPQLRAYAEILRKLHGTSTPIRAALYYPRMSLFDWWEI